MILHDCLDIHLGLYILLVLVLQKYYSGEKDNKTLEILSKMSKEKVNVIRRNQ